MSERDRATVGPHEVQVLSEDRDADGQRVLTMVQVRLCGKPVRHPVDHQADDWGLVARHADDRFAVSVGTGWLRNVYFPSIHDAVDALRTRAGLERLRRIARLETDLLDARTRTGDAEAELREICGITADGYVWY